MRGEIVTEDRVMSEESLRYEIELMNESDLLEMQIAAKSYLRTTLKLLSFGAMVSYTSDVKALLEAINRVKTDKGLLTRKS